MILLVGFLIAILLMLASWILARRRRFFSLVDVSWAYGIGLIGLFYAITGSGLLTRRILVSTLLTFWSARLGTHLLLRLKEKFPKEDQRYEKLKASWQPNSESRFFWFFQFQALSQPVLCIPIYLAMGSLAQLSVVDFIGTLLCLMGLVGEAAADSQLKSFKASKENLGKVCDLGLWKYSRHPNYFFEWLIWCGFSCFGLSSQYWYLSPLSAAIIYVLLNYMTGIPPAEEQSLLSKGDKYRAYQAKTSRFFPWVPHK